MALKLGRSTRSAWNQFFEANDIANAKKRAVLVSTCGKQTYQLICSLLSPAKPADCSYDEICKKLKEHFDPAPLEMVLRFRFYDRSRQPNETVADFLADLGRLAHDCNFGSSLDSMLRDRLVLGIGNEAIQQRLLAEKTLTLASALSIALAQETVGNRQSIAKAVPRQDNVNAIKPDPQKQQERRRCFRCLSLAISHQPVPSSGENVSRARNLVTQKPHADPKLHIAIIQ